jgi:light-regulated signal transduction histidine kinase (bacteriophytochrome)
LWTNDQRALAADGPIHAEANLSHRDGSLHTYLIVNFPIKDIQTGTARSLCSIAIDITDRKAAEAQIQELNTELEYRVVERTSELRVANAALLHSNAELKHFAHATAHDLQTPLRSIVGFTQLLQKEVRGRVNEDVDEWSTRVVDNTKRLQTLIQEILSYSRLESEGLPFEPTDLRKLLNEVLASLAGLIGETQAEVSCGALPTLLVDRTQVAQVFQNLIENGIKYNQSKPPRIAVAGGLQEDQWVFSVADNGIGIDPKHHDRIFELFQRLHTYYQIPGTGIGLPLCRRIVERHGGHVWVDSRLGDGSTFYFSLPLERNEVP